MQTSGLVAGRELDGQIAEMVFDWPHECRLVGGRTYRRDRPICRAALAALEP